MPMPYPGRALRTAALLSCAALVGGCAVQTDRRGQLQFQVDNAELFGQTVQTFTLPDGSEARLRVLNGQYSIKLQKYMRVIPLENATDVKVRSTAVIDGRGVIVIDKAERNCGFKMHLISVKGSEVLAWDFGDCQTAPTVNLYADGATFDFAYPNRTIRYTYQNARLVRNDYNGAPPGPPAASAGPVASGAPRHVPGLPSAPNGERPGGPATSAAAASGATAPASARPTAAPRTASAAPAAPARRNPPAPTTSRTPTPAPSTAMNFPAQEQKPVRIVLDN